MASASETANSVQLDEDHIIRCTLEQSDLTGCNLVSYLDAHVPDEQYDYLFANNVVGHLLEGLSFTRRCIRSQFLNMLDKEGLFMAQARLNRVLQFANDLVNDYSSWPNNGRSHEIARQLYPRHLIPFAAPSPALEKAWRRGRRTRRRCPRHRHAHNVHRASECFARIQWMAADPNRRSEGTQR